MLDEGNRRFVEGRSVHPNTDVFRVGETGEHGQHPFAAVLACADSRVAVERLFDRGMGDLFVVRVAGNIGDPNQAGSLEYACEHLGTRLVVVMGHTGCGAVKAAVEGVSTGTNIGSLLDNIAPAVREVRAAHPELSGEGLVEAVVRQNVWRTIEDTLRGSASLRAGVQSEAVRMVGAVYDVRNGRVEWMGNHPALAGLLASGATGHGQASAAPTPTEMLAPAAKTPGERTPASPGHAAKPGVKGPAAVKPSDEQHTPAHTAHPH
jgi:carbonic anhydrase